MRPTDPHRLRRGALPVLALLVALAGPALGGRARAGNLFLDEQQLASLAWGLDAYYSFASLSLSLIPPIPGVNVLDASEEASVYGTLLANLYLPRTFNLELSLNPLPVLGTYVKSRHRGFYGRAELWELNLIKMVTEGFPEPGALSLFLGNTVYLVNPETGETEGIGFGGFLVSYGNYHIINNVLVPDHWLELETKLKGVTLSKQRDRAFSFRVGAKLHSHEDVESTVYASLKRSHTDRDYAGWSPLLNSELEARFDFNMRTLGPARVLVLFGKKLPTFEGAVVFSVAVGVLGVLRSGYRGELARESVDEGWTFLLRPNVTF